MQGTRETRHPQRKKRNQSCPKRRVRYERAKKWVEKRGKEYRKAGLQKTNKKTRPAWETGSRGNKQGRGAPGVNKPTQGTRLNNGVGDRRRLSLKIKKKTGRAKTRGKEKPNSTQSTPRRQFE